VSPEVGGAFVAVVGPSGAGKDTLLNGAQDALGAHRGITFVRRVITRAADGATEDHDTLTPEAFEHARQADAFALHWDANGLRYALPASALQAVRAGDTVVANLSRGALAPALAVFGSLHVVEITASRAVLRERLINRGRETADAVEQRLDRSRALALPAGTASHTVIENSGAAADGITTLVEAIRSAASAPR
jgi:ribose 1,5-bisphosphokinase